MRPTTVAGQVTYKLVKRRALGGEAIEARRLDRRFALTSYYGVRDHLMGWVAHGFSRGGHDSTVNRVPHL